MTTLADRVVAALRANHDTLAALVPNLSDTQLKGRSGAAEWTVADALSHLGSGAEISRKPIAIAASEHVDAEDNQAVWARWNAASPADQAAGFVKYNAAYLDTVDGLSAEQRDLPINTGILPEPVSLAVALGLRLNEVANHAWDVRVGVDPSATLEPGSAELLLELFGGPMAFLLGFAGKPDQLEQEVRLAIPGGGITITDTVTVAGVDDPTATFEGPAEAVVRLLTGRLGAEHAAGVSVTGNVTLDELRKVFPGY
ncbi:maleylpyruvate isomerase family mycothiol-dependent enzyme [Kribbella speibonae]|uniref:Maleylpyruvate isomerase family mycothiol-dependent enzyme n=1 Tax=Kribbella speibonae TaxID=1572660 RepID=A0ABY2ABR6_9ACTN|nr:maleylpyruvate isomerase family mycothiol-dependent enzyme [Kribbella speibonae]TCC26946.1 maleylpyruvate isomerase family mycothiol-dependent enzyme [Kribbella speibonae]